MCSAGDNQPFLAISWLGAFVGAIERDKLFLVTKEAGTATIRASLLALFDLPSSGRRESVPFSLSRSRNIMRLLPLVVKASAAVSLRVSDIKRRFFSCFVNCFLW